MNIFQGRGVLKNAIFENNGRRLNHMRYSSMNDRIAPESGLRLFLRSSLHTTPARDICENHSNHGLLLYAPPPKDQGGDEIHPSPEKI